MERYREVVHLRPSCSLPLLEFVFDNFMNVFELTRALVDIESVTPNEERVGNYLFEYLTRMAESTGGRVERMEVEPHRFNVFAYWGEPVVTFSTHMDTVPPFFGATEDDEFIHGRGA